MLKTTLTKELTNKILEIIEINNKTYDEKEALKKNKIILDAYGIPNINGKFAYSEVTEKFYNADVLKDMENKEHEKKYDDVDSMFEDLEG